MLLFGWYRSHQIVLIINLLLILCYTLLQNPTRKENAIGFYALIYVCVK